MARMMTPAERAELARIRQRDAETADALNNLVAQLGAVLGNEDDLRVEPPDRISITREHAEQIVRRLSPGPSRDEILIRMEADAHRRSVDAIAAQICPRCHAAFLPTVVHRCG